MKPFGLAVSMPACAPTNPAVRLRPMARRDKPDKPLPLPTEAGLHETALRHLARYATTRVGLVRVLDRRVARWARAVEADAEAQSAPRDAVRAVVTRLVAAGVVDDAVFAAARTTGLSRTGRSRRAVAAHLSERGVTREVAEVALAGAPAELAAAAAAAKRRRIGPFRSVDDVSPELARKELGVLARAGFAQDVARRALALDRDEAEALLAQLRAT